MALSSTNPASKTPCAAVLASSSPSIQTGISQGGDTHFHRRSGGSGSFGAGSATRSRGSKPRNKQSAKNQLKPSRRYLLADEDAIAETAAMRSTNSRKGQTSITHLMNFSLPPRPQRSHQHVDHYRYGRRNSLWGLGSGYHAADKARYVHANYRFIVDPRRDYRAQSVDADVYLDWDTVLQILVSPQSQEAACPICLGDPVAPRMAKCGHIFCLSCLIRYMHSTDDTDHGLDKRARWKKCPICWDSVYISETRPVRWYVGQEGAPPREGGDVILRLVMRPAGSTLALPLEISYSLPDEEDIPWHFAVDVMDYARVMKGSEEYMLMSFDEEIEQLRTLERHDELMFGEDTEWTTRAIRTVNDAKGKIRGIGNAQMSVTQSEEARAKRNPILQSRATNGPPDLSIVHDASKAAQNIPSGLDTLSFASSTREAEGLSDRPKLGLSTSAISTSIAQYRSDQHASHTTSDYFFYQALLHYYLSPLDIRILKQAFGDYSSFPSTILPRVERVSTGHVVDEDLRKRAKYLAHLPHGCEVNFLECDWTDTVSPSVLEKFKVDIDRRRKRNHDKEVREEKERVRAEKEEDDKRFAAARRRRPGVSGEQFHPEDFQPLVSQDANESFGSVDTATESSPPIYSSLRVNRPSFASLASPSTSPGTNRTVWGTSAIAPTSPPVTATSHDLNIVDDGWLQGWENDLLHEEGLVAQFEAASVTGESNQNGSRSSKKKKGKKITLMSTNARRGA